MSLLCSNSLKFQPICNVNTQKVEACAGVRSLRNFENGSVRNQLTDVERKGLVRVGERI